MFSPLLHPSSLLPAPSPFLPPASPLLSDSLRLLPPHLLSPAPEIRCLQHDMCACILDSVMTSAHAVPFILSLLI